MNENLNKLIKIASFKQELSEEISLFNKLLSEPTIPPPEVSDTIVLNPEQTITHFLENINEVQKKNE
jgi:hypothetical protein